jgi:AraC-like DNA-binding protein
MPPIAECLSFHVVAQGECWLEVGEEKPIFLRTGDLVLVPHGRGHWMRSEPGAASCGRVDEMPQEMLSDHYSLLRCGGGGAKSVLICGVVGFDQPTVSRLLDQLPVVIHIEDLSAEQDRIRQILRLMASELRELKPGGEAVTTRLADILIIEVIRSWLATDPAARTGWLAALRDPQLHPALTAIHRSPGTDWTVESLARQATMSRSAFAARFTHLVGEPAMRYLTRHRMDVACTRLTQGDSTVATIATDLGYQSETSFSKAFTRTVGTPPATYRRTTRRTSDV